MCLEFGILITNLAIYRKVYLYPRGDAWHCSYWLSIQSKTLDIFSQWLGLGTHFYFVKVHRPCRRQRSDRISHRVKLPPVSTSSLATQRYRQSR